MRLRQTARSAIGHIGEREVVRPIIIFMLLIAAVNLIRTVVIVAVRTARPKWSSFALSLFTVGILLDGTGREYIGATGADVLRFFGAASFGMSFIAAMMMVREAPESTTIVRGAQR